MTTPLADLLKKARGTVKQIVVASKAGLSRGTICEYEKGKSCPRLETLPKLAKAYSITLEELTCALTHTKTGTVPTLKTANAAQPRQEDSENNLFLRTLESLAGKVETLAKDHATVFQYLETIKAIPQVGSIGNRDPRVVSTTDEGWVSVCGNKNWTRRTLFVEKDPATLLAELHRVAPGYGSVHVQDIQPTRPKTRPYFELWSVVQGECVLLIEPHKRLGQWQEIPAVAGACGSYHAADRHIWLNTHPTSALFIFFILFPYRQVHESDVIKGFSMEDMDGCLPAEASEALRQAIRKRIKVRRKRI